MEIPTSLRFKWIPSSQTDAGGSRTSGPEMVRLVTAPTEDIQNVKRCAMAAYSLGLIAGLAMVLYGFQAQSFVTSPIDPYFFAEMGKSLARGQGFEAYGVLLKRRAPLYPMFIGGIYSVFGENPGVVLLFQCFLLGGTCWLAFDLGRRLFNRRTGVVAAIFTAFHPMMLRYVADLHLETLLTFLFTLLIWCSVRFYSNPTIGNGVLTGVAAALAALTKAVVVLYPAVFVGWWLIRVGLREGLSPLRTVPWTAILSIFLTMAAGIAPWTARNYRATGGHLVLISSGFSDAFLRGYIFSKRDYALLRRPPFTDAENECNAWFRAECQRAGTEWEKDDYETDQILNRVAKEKLFTEPAEFGRKVVVGLFTFWYEMTSFTNSLLTGVLAAGAWILAFVGCYRGRREGRPVWLVLLPVVYLNLLLAALLALGRYSAPVLPALLVASAYGADFFISKLTR